MGGKKIPNIGPRSSILTDANWNSIFAIIRVTRTRNSLYEKKISFSEFPEPRNFKKLRLPKYDDISSTFFLKIRIIVFVFFYSRMRRSRRSQTAHDVSKFIFKIFKKKKFEILGYAVDFKLYFGNFGVFSNFEINTPFLRDYFTHTRAFLGEKILTVSQECGKKVHQPLGKFSETKIFDIFPRRFTLYRRFFLKISFEVWGGWEAYTKMGFLFDILRNTKLQFFVFYSREIQNFEFPSKNFRQFF